MTEISPEPDAHPEGERAELTLYFILHGRPTSPSNESSDEVSSDPGFTTVRISVELRAEEARVLQDLSRYCHGVVIQSQQSGGQPNVIVLGRQPQ